MRRINRIPLTALLVAGTALLSTTALAGFSHPAGHPSGSFHAAPHPGMRAFHPAPFHAVMRPGAAHFTAGFHPLHAALIAHVGFARFTPAQRWAWTHGSWFHRWYNGRWGWWWFAGGAWFWYDAPIYPYPTIVSDDYYETPDYGPPTWWYCYNPPGYYPYVPGCYGQWQPVPVQGYGQAYGEEGPEQGPPPGAYDNGPAPEQSGGQGPPPGYSQGPPQGSEQGPPPGYGQGPPQGYDQGPPAGYDQGPPPGYDQGPPPGYDQGPPPGEYQGPPTNQQGPNDQNSNYPPDNGRSGPG